MQNIKATYLSAKQEQAYYLRTLCCHVGLQSLYDIKVLVNCKGSDNWVNAGGRRKKISASMGVGVKEKARQVAKKKKGFRSEFRLRLNGPT